MWPFDKKDDDVQKGAGSGYDSTYSLFDLFRGEGAQIDAPDSAGNIFVEQANETNSGESVTVDNLLEEATTMTCINAIVQGITQVPIEVRKGLEDGTYEVQKDHPVNKLLSKRPNDYQTPSEFMSSVVTAMLTHGNAFIYIVRAGTDQSKDLKHGTGRALMLYPFDPSDITIGANAFGKPVYQHESVGHIPTRNIIHIRDLQTYTPQGISRALQAAEIIGAKKAADRLMSETFRTGTSLQYVISSDATVSAEAKQKFVEQFSAMFGRGGKRRNGAAFIEQGNIQKIEGVKPADVDLRELRSQLIQEIAGVFRVPAFIAGGPADVTYSNVRQQWASFHRDTLQPLVTNIEEAITLKLIEDDDLYVFFNVAELLKGDVETTARIAQQNVSNGIWTPNEGRQYIGTGRHDSELADELIQPNSSSNLNTTDVSDDPSAATEGEDGPQGADNEPDAQLEQEIQDDKG